MYLNSIYIGLKVVPIQVLWGQSMSYLGTWTLRVGALDPSTVNPYMGVSENGGGTFSWGSYYLGSPILGFRV